MRLAEGEKRLKKCIADRGLRNSVSRSEVLNEFLRADRHITVDDLYKRISARIPHIGIATVYRSLHFFCECGIARELKLEDGTSRYEPLFGHEHHDHLVCRKCGKFIELVDKELELVQKKIAEKHGFSLKDHKMELFGICSDCR